MRLRTRLGVDEVDDGREGVHQVERQDGGRRVEKRRRVKNSRNGVDGSLGICAICGIKGPEYKSRRRSDSGAADLPYLNPPAGGPWPKPFPKPLPKGSLPPKKDLNISNGSTGWKVPKGWKWAPSGWLWRRKGVAVPRS